MRTATSRLIVLLFVMTGNLWAQTPVAGRWAPTRGVNRNPDDSPAGSSVRITATQERDLNAVVQRLDRILRASSALAPPPGREALLITGTDYHPGSLEEGRPRPAGAPIPVQSRLLLFELYRECDTCPIQRATEADTGVSFWLNNLAVAFQPAEPKPNSESETQWYLAPRLMGKAQGQDVWEGGHGRVIVTGSSRPLFIPVTQEAFLTRLLAQLRREGRSTQSGLNAQPTGQAQALAEMRAAIQEIERTNPAAADEMRRTLAASQAQMAAGSGGVAAEAAQGLAALQGNVDEVERELQQMTPGERQSPAYFPWGPPAEYRDAVLHILEDFPAGTDTAVRASGLVSAANPGGRMVVRMNPDYCDRTKSPTAIQLLVLESWQGGDPTSVMDRPVPLGIRQNIFATWDWNAVRNLVER